MSGRETSIHHADDYAEALVRFRQWLLPSSNLRFKKSLRALDDMILRIIAERRSTATQRTTCSRPTRRTAKCTPSGRRRRDL